MRPRDLEEIRKEVEAIRDSKGEPVDEKIKDLVTGLRRWGIGTESSCEGHLDHGLPYPWIDIPRGNLEDVSRILGVWWSGKDKQLPAENNPRWVIRIAGTIRLIPENKDAASLQVLQEEAIAFGKFLQQIPDDYFKRKSPGRSEAT